MANVVAKVKVVEKVKCNYCEWCGDESKLVQCFEINVKNNLIDYGAVSDHTTKQYGDSPNIEYLSGCPNCHTDKYLTYL